MQLTIGTLQVQTSEERMSDFIRSGNTITMVSGFTTMQWISIDNLTGGSWTASDPNSLVSSYAFSEDEHSIGLVTVNPANADYALNSGTNFTGPRWYKPLVDVAGVPVLAQDKFTMSVRFRGFDGGTSRQWGIWCGLAESPASTTLTTLDTSGHWMGLTGVGTPILGTGFSGSGTVVTVSLAAGTSSLCNGQYGGAPGKSRAGTSGVIYSTSASDDIIRADGGTMAVSDATQLSLWLCATSLGNVATTAGTIKVKIDYGITRL